MSDFLYRCPVTGYVVDGRYEGTDEPPPSYVAQTCPACRSVHLVNPVTGKLISEERPARPPRRPRRSAPPSTGRAALFSAFPPL